MADSQREDALLKAALLEHQQALDMEIARFEQGAAACATTPFLDAKIRSLIRGKRQPRVNRSRLLRWAWAVAGAACLLLFISLGGGAGLFSAWFGAGAGAPSSPGIAAPPAEEAGAASEAAGADALEAQPRCQPGWLPEGFTAAAAGGWTNAAGQYIRISTDSGLTEAEVAGDKSYEWRTLENGLWYFRESDGVWQLICYAPGYPVIIRTDLPREEALQLAENLLFT